MENFISAVCVDILGLANREADSRPGNGCHQLTVRLVAWQHGTHSRAFLWETNKNMPLTEHQSQAAIPILQALTSAYRPQQVVLEGYAGVGKTFTTAHICSALLSAGYTVHATAPTHKAANVLQSNLPPGVHVSTIHSALGVQPCYRTQSLRKSRPHSLAGVDVLIVDESSMVCEHLYDIAQEVINSVGLNVMWVGDPAQISPVRGNGSENQYKISPVFERVQKRYRLTEITRQAEGSAIIRASMYLRECYERNVLPELSTLLERVGDSDDVTVIDRASAVEWMLSARRHGYDARYIAYTNAINEQVTAAILQATRSPDSPRFRPGDAVVFNRGMGVEIRTDQLATIVENLGIEHRYGPAEIDCYYLAVDIDGRTAYVYTPVMPGQYDAVLRKIRSEFNEARKGEDFERRDQLGLLISEFQETYADVRHMYAMTAHKSQGSTFDVAMVDWRSMIRHSSIAEACRLLYVACTRPSKHLVLVV